MLAEIKLHDFRCFQEKQLTLHPQLQFLLGPNAVGKTSILEAICVLLRLASPRVSALNALIRAGHPGFGLEGFCHERKLQFFYRSASSPHLSKTRILRLDDVNQPKSTPYLRVAKLVYFGNSDLELVRGSGEIRRRYLDFLGAQIEPLYLSNLRIYERALRSRNRLLKQFPLPWREIDAYTEPLIESGNIIIQLRKHLIAALSPWAQEAQVLISQNADLPLLLQYEPGTGEHQDLASALKSARDEEIRLRQTVVGPHRDDFRIQLGENRAANLFASEGQQRTIALSLKLAQAKMLEALVEKAAPPLLLLDDIFGELDQKRRNALFAALPESSQKVITATSVDWYEGNLGKVGICKLQ